MMNKLFLTLLAAAVTITTACQSTDTSEQKNTAQDTVSTTVTTQNNTNAPIDTDKINIADAKTILARPQVPILCYHQVRNWKTTDGKVGKDYIVERENFAAQIKMLADSGYQTILPDQLYAYLNEGTPLPKKPIMLTFDDTVLDQYTVVNPLLKKYGFKAAYFVMTVSIGKKAKYAEYMTAEQIKTLSDEGNTIGSHTYDHKNFKKYTDKDWEEQLDNPTKRLEEITGKKIEYFAYPFGLWNKEGFPELKKRGFKIAFALADKRDENDPLMCVRRIIASGYWSPKTLHNSIVKSF